MSVHDLLASLNGVKERGAGKWIAQCPAHKDKSPSLSILEKPDGRVLVHCFAGCDLAEVLRAVNMTLADLLPDHLLAEYLPPVSRPHAHAAADILKVMAHEALVVAMAGENMLFGRELEWSDLDRVAEAVVLLRDAAESV